jgi:hypothetical protein
LACLSESRPGDRDLFHPFDDAAKLAAELPRAQLVRARSPIELRWRPDRLTDVIATFIEGLWAQSDDTEAGAVDQAG